MSTENKFGASSPYAYPALYSGNSQACFSNFVNSFQSMFILQLSSGLRSSELKDFVYSLFGLISDAEEVGLRVDYSKTVEEVYKDFAKAILRVLGIGQLSQLWNPSQKHIELPSWVPDWSEMTPRTHSYLAWSNPTPFAEISSVNGVDDHRLLQIKGVRLGQISNLQLIFKERGRENRIPAVLSSSPQMIQEYRSFLDNL